MSRIITISREFGSGGRELGKRLANALGIPCYDHEIIEMIAKENGFNEDYVANVGGKEHRGRLSPDHRPPLWYAALPDHGSAHPRGGGAARGSWRISPSRATASSSAAPPM